jgi:predicted TIM-barrel fold metal-dependent hydrolase
MKLSGAFNEFDATPSITKDIVAALQPFLDNVFQNFPKRVMFGSDWPVCNVGGPRGDDGNWKYWVEIVDQAMTERGFTEEERDAVWWQVGVKAYEVNV